jgi:hypothetical protein
VTLASVGSLATSRGTAVLRFHEDMGFLEVTVTVHGLAAIGKHRVDIERGSCETPGPILYPIPDLQVGADGSGDVTDTVVGVQARPPAGTWAVWVRAGPSEKGHAIASQPPLLCGGVP